MNTSYPRRRLLAKKSLLAFAIIAYSFMSYLSFQGGVFKDIHSSLGSQKTPQVGVTRTSNEEAIKIERRNAQDGFKPLLNANVNDTWKRDLFSRLDDMRSNCGALCNINDMHSYSKFAKAKKDGSSFVRLEAPVDCKSLFEMEGIDAGDITFPSPPPEELVHFYSLNGTISISVRKRWKVEYLGSDAAENIWTKEQIDEEMKSLQEGTLAGTYGTVKTNELRDYLKDKMDMNGKSVLVIGSERPWLETAALNAGAAKVTTLEYGAITSQHPQINTFTPAEFRTSYLNKSMPRFDAVLSHSSLEHSGLGRYGDALNPWGDILSLARAWCVTKEEGQLMLGLPSGKDYIRWNAHRCYGNIRWPLITINWDPIDGVVNFDDGTERSGGTLHLFKKISPTTEDVDVI